jgi:hypothetical protein
MKGPLFKWFGSKWNASRYYPTPAFDTIVEPYAGGAGYSCRHAARKVYLIECNLQVVSLWRWLIHEASSDDVRHIPLNLPEGTDIRTLDLGEGPRLLLKHWQRTNNFGNCWTISAWGSRPGQWTANTRARVAEEIHEVKHWHVATSLPSDMHITQGFATWFIDPPYEYNYSYGLKNFRHEDVCNLVNNLPHAEIIACEARHPRTEAIPTYLPFVDFRSTVTSRRSADNHHHSREVWYYRAGT